MTMTIDESLAIDNALEGVQLLNTYAQSELEPDDLTSFQTAFAGLLENYDLLGTEASLTAMCASQATVEVIDPCVHCGKSTSFGSGLYVNRIPAETEDADGYMCASCQSIECVVCKQPTLDYSFNDEGDALCDECSEKAHTCTVLWSTEGIELTNAHLNCYYQNDEEIKRLMLGVVAEELGWDIEDIGDWEYPIIIEWIMPNRVEFRPFMGLVFVTDDDSKEQPSMTATGGYTWNWH
jgi:hypothetical protein